MSLSEKLDEYIRACFSGIWIESHEHQDAIVAIAELCNRESWRLATWDIEQGLNSAGAHVDAPDPLAAVRSLSAMATADGTTLLVLQNFHRFLSSPEIVQAIIRAVVEGKQQRTFVIVLAPVVSLPIELDKLLVVIEHERPDRTQLEAIARGIATEDDELPSGHSLDLILDASSGLTRYEAENAYSLSLVRHGRIEPSAIWELKTQTLKKGGLLSLYRGDDDFSGLGGLAALKAFTRRALLHGGRGDRLARPRGVMLLSPPGCGKSQFCKSLGKEVGRPVLILDVGSLMGSLVGQSEERTRQALRTIDAMAPCIAMIDEVEKAFSGAGGSNGDSGVSSRMFAAFLSWLNDHESDVFVVCTANDIAKLPPEFARAERFDGVFFLDLPDRQQKDAIWQLYLEQFDLDRDQRRPADDQWTGAEIRSCCRLAALLDLPLVQAAQNVVPVAVTSGESVERLRTWASGRCLSADQPGIYRHETKANSSSRRKVSRDPSVN
jgi:hypothetical protein